MQEMVKQTAKFSLAGARQRVTECSVHFWVSFRVVINAMYTYTQVRDALSYFYPKKGFG